jgi:hypothetical protein
MGVKPITANEMGRRGGTTRAKRHNKAQIRTWGKLGGRPLKLDSEAMSKLRRMLRERVAKGGNCQETGNLDPNGYPIPQKDELECRLTDTGR